MPRATHLIVIPKHPLKRVYPSPYIRLILLTMVIDFPFMVRRSLGARRFRKMDVAITERFFDPKLSYPRK
jgi:hypothetical protein